MGLCVSVDENGYLFNTGQTLDDCTTAVVVSSDQYNEMLEPLITPIQVTEAFLWGFGVVVVLGYFTAYPVGIAQRLINKI